MKSVLLPLVVVLAGAGCVQNDLNLTLEHFVPADRSANCVISPTSTVIQTDGILDVGIVQATGSPGYTAFPVIKNHLPPTTNTTTDVERRSILVKGVNVELRPDPSLEAVIPSDQRKFFVPAGAGRLDPQASIAFGVEVLPRAVAIALAGAVSTGVGNAFPRVTARVSPVGDYGGDTVVGASVDYPINVCKFCLSGSPTSCPAGGFEESMVSVGGCLVAQDVNVTCCLASQTQLLCGEQVPVKTM